MSSNCSCTINDFVSAAVFLVMILYASQVAPKLIASQATFFNNYIVKFLYCVVLLYVVTKNIKIAVVSSIVVILLLVILSKMISAEGFLSLQDNMNSQSESESESESVSNSQESPEKLQELIQQELSAPVVMPYDTNNLNNLDNLDNIQEQEEPTGVIPNVVLHATPESNPMIESEELRKNYEETIGLVSNNNLDNLDNLANVHEETRNDQQIESIKPSNSNEVEQMNITPNDVHEVRNEVIQVKQSIEQQLNRRLTKPELKRIVATIIDSKLAKEVTGIVDSRVGPIYARV